MSNLNDRKETADAILAATKDEKGEPRKVKLALNGTNFSAISYLIGMDNAGFLIAENATTTYHVNPDYIRSWYLLDEMAESSD